ncbi:hypothetical protein M2161_009140 [Streptomyces sp. SAI-133]|uniref:hypothetical protein n=1 Tax=unclassified Streptomyces TaxID=2593676 RepID=UPI002473688A|nr:hypothetical protein [Streptomyces sp. SAI-133]MDH6589949.1 hypothetical protein [Streptomyces sp. SAI-133]
MTRQRSGDGPERTEVTARELTDDQKVFVTALRQEFRSRFTQRGFAREVRGVDHSSLSRYFSGDRMVPEKFIDWLYEQAQEQGCPISPARRDELKHLRAAALRSSASVNHRLQRSVEDLQASLESMTVRWCEQREQAEVQQHLRALLLEDRRVLLAAMEQLQRDLTASCDALAQADAERAQAQNAHTQALRQLQAASEYVHDLHNQLASSERQVFEMAETIRRLEHELSVLRRQVHLLKEEPETKTLQTAEAEQGVAAPATPTSATPSTRTWPWWLAANLAFLGSFALILAGMAHLEHDRHITFADALFPAGGLLSLLFIATPLIGHAAGKDGAYSTISSDADDVAYGYYPMM